LEKCPVIISVVIIANFGQMSEVVIFQLQLYLT